MWKTIKSMFGCDTTMKKTPKEIKGESIADTIPINNNNTIFIVVETLIYNQNGVLLSWAKGEALNSGWKIPSGIVRYQESLRDRVQKTLLEKFLLLDFECSGQPTAMHELMFRTSKPQAHFLTFLFDVIAPKDFKINNFDKNPGDDNYLQWFKECPKNLIECNTHYIKDINRVLSIVNQQGWMG